MQGSGSVAANSGSTNQLTGQLYEFLVGNAHVVLTCTGSATGLRTTFWADGVTLINDQAIGFLVLSLNQRIEISDFEAWFAGNGNMINECDTRTVDDLWKLYGEALLRA